MSLLGTGSSELPTPACQPYILICVFELRYAMVLQLFSPLRYGSSTLHYIRMGLHFTFLSLPNLFSHQRYFVKATANEI